MSWKAESQERRAEGQKDSLALSPSPSAIRVIGVLIVTAADFLEPLRRLHDEIRARVLAACEEQSAVELARVAHEGAGDVTYEVDRISEVALLDWFTREIAAHEPIVLIGEGLPSGQVTLPAGTTDADARWRIIVDPIDGTRGLMYQKRPAFVLTGVAPNRGPKTSLADIEVAVQTEIPLMKQHLCDQLWATRGGGATGVRTNRLTGESQPLAMRPSEAAGLRHGFATICRFFPGGRDVLAALDDALCDRLVPRTTDKAAVFEDQYASTSGQLYGLSMGQDRFVADLRPLVGPLVAARGSVPGHCCHPYDFCTALIAEEAGVVVTTPTGNPLDAPLDVESNVAWVGYANGQLRSHVEPVLRELLSQYGLTS
jgi:fructose-1,6-bisphosphatase/inositol monophosphatase family enzyme